MMLLPRPAAVTIDILSAGAIAATLMQFLPPIAAMAGIIWYAIQIWESKSVQRWWVTHQHRTQVRKLALASANAQLAAEAARNNAAQP